MPDNVVVQITQPLPASSTNVVVKPADTGKSTVKVATLGDRGLPGATGEKGDKGEPGITILPTDAPINGGFF